MTKEAVARQFFMDFLENLGDYEYDPYAGYGEDESHMIIADFFLRWPNETKMGS